MAILSDYPGFRCQAIKPLQELAERHERIVTETKPVSQRHTEPVCGGAIDRHCTPLPSRPYLARPPRACTCLHSPSSRRPTHDKNTRKNHQKS